MDWVRTFGVTRVQLWADSDEWTEIRWFRADPGAKVFAGVHRYPWTENLQTDRAPKVAPPWLDVEWEYDRGNNYLGYRGANVCGNLEAFERGGIHGTDSEIPTDVDGIAECCRVAERDGTGRIVWDVEEVEAEVPAAGLAFAGGAGEVTMEPWSACGAGSNSAILTVPAGQALRLRFASVNAMDTGGAPYEWWISSFLTATHTCVLLSGQHTEDWALSVWDGELWIGEGRQLRFTSQGPSSAPEWYLSGELVTL